MQSVLFDYPVLIRIVPTIFIPLIRKRERTARQEELRSEEML
jgi:hypothetical protein